eukprot:TRINITY_DN17595_c0_g1_i1.p1 TRINITY_DN17595_c0_g1~~TRINITY_DN17595_c0_g1_i1.p1  ORF type:complete len:338 (+),score=67.92 TRINITY_DN17595_c0_g1_i1:151-1164(+)
MPSLFDALPWRISATVARCLEATADNAILVERQDPVKSGHANGARLPRKSGRAHGSKNNGVNGHVNGHSEAESSDNDREERLVLVLGWGGALQRHLARLREFYLNGQFAVISYISPMACYLQGGLVEADIVELAACLRREVANVRRKALHVHIHSNNGTFVWGALMLELQKSAPEVLDALSGLVLDSAPRLEPRARGPPGIVKQALGFTFPCVPLVVKQNRYVHPVWTPALFFFFLARLTWQRLWQPARQRAEEQRYKFAEVREALLHGIPTRVPQLYIYSAGDRLISANAVEEYMALQRQRGVKVVARRFEDTPHVQHFLRRAGGYKDALRAFLGA